MFISPKKHAASCLRHNVVFTGGGATVDGMLSICSLGLRWNYRYAFYFTGVQA